MNRKYNVAEANIAGAFPPLGLAYLASYLRQFGRYEVKLIDLNVEGFSQGRLVSLIRNFGPNVIGLSSTTLIWPNVCGLARLVKTLLPKSLIVIGGPQLSLYPVESLSFSFIDVGVLGEGEETFLEVLEHYENGNGLEDVAGIIFKRRGETVPNSPRPPISDLDALPFPAMELFPLNRYFAFGVKRPFLTMISSRGCPYSCHFCLQGTLGRFRQRSAESLVEEMEYDIDRFKVRELIFFDETFTYDKARTLRICDLIIKKNLQIRWSIRTRADEVDRDMMRCLREAGCYFLHLGIESTNEATLGRMKKNLNLQSAKRNIEIAKEEGLSTRGYFMLGYPHEGPNEIAREIRASKGLNLDWATYSITSAHPGTELYRDFREMYVEDDIWREWTLRHKLSRLPYFGGQKLGIGKLRWLRRFAYINFYLNPERIWNLLLFLKPIGLFEFISFRVRRLIAHRIYYENFAYQSAAQ